MCSLISQALLNIERDVKHQIKAVYYIYHMVLRIDNISQSEIRAVLLNLNIP